MTLSPAQLASFEKSGYLLQDHLISDEGLETLRIEADRLLAESDDRSGVRNVLQKSALLANLAVNGPLSDLSCSVLGKSAKPVKLTIFDKTPDANWKVPWHQDLTITVRERCELGGLGPWTVKDGVVHVQPPIDVLEQIVAIRLHLDETTAENGALRVLPGTHKLGRLPDSEIRSLRDRIAQQDCPVPEGGAMLMRPLLLHASSACKSPSRRRVLHFEFSASLLPFGLDWA